MMASRKASTSRKGCCVQSSARAMTSSRIFEKMVKQGLSKKASLGLNGNNSSLEEHAYMNDSRQKHAGKDSPAFPSSIVFRLQ